MQIVIDVDEKVYNMYDKLVNILNIETSSWAGQIFVNALKNGKPLPKGHGDLIDRREFQKDDYLERRYGYDFYREFQSRLKKQPTVVEADKVEREDKE